LTNANIAAAIKKAIDEFTELMAAGLSAEYLVITATDALDGYALLCQRKPDVVVLDVMMPLVDGWAVLRKLRSNPAVSSVAVIIVTGLEPEAARHEADRLGVRQILIKPVSPAQLVKAIRAATEQN
jgi:DNA-binding response OmpR family regulator